MLKVFLGTNNYPNQTWVATSYKYTDLGISFIPTIIFVTIDSVYLTACSLLNVNETTKASTTNMRAYFSNINNSGFTYNGYYNWSKDSIDHTLKYYVIGVGEEDTTLRDSLASILQEEGVSVTEEDDMASLISKVDEEFDRQVIPAGDAVASNVLSGKTFINNTGQTVTGTMANNGTKTFTPKATEQSDDAGYYTKVTCKGDSNLVAANIVSGKSIFGVAGSATVSNLGGCSVVAGNTFTVASEKLSESSSYSTSETSYTITSIPQGIVRVNINIKTAASVQKGPICNFYHNGQLIAGNITGNRDNVYNTDFDIQIKNGDVFKIDMTPRSTATYNYCTMTIYFSLS